MQDFSSVVLVSTPCMSTAAPYCAARASTSLAHWFRLLPDSSAALASDRPRGPEPGQSAFAGQLLFELGQRHEDAEREVADRGGGVDLNALNGEHPQGHCQRKTGLIRRDASCKCLWMKSPFRYFKTSPEIIRLAVMMYVRFPLSLRNVEDLLHERAGSR